jgi:hypothetical protein
VQYLPTISPFGIDGNTSTQMPFGLNSASALQLCSRNDSASVRPNVIFSPPLTSMSKKKYSSSDLVAKQTPPVIYKHLGNSPDIQ